jgi:hypothetical protein
MYAYASIYSRIEAVTFIPGKLFKVWNMQMTLY